MHAFPGCVHELGFRQDLMAVRPYVQSLGRCTPRVLIGLGSRQNRAAVTRLEDPARYREMAK